MAKARAYGPSNPAFTGSGVAGTEANHSSLVPSTENDIGAHAQSDDELQDVPPPQDPNISGATPTEDTHSWLAGKLSAWQENDDYRKFLERGDVAESATAYRYESVHDGDYDDNGGVALGAGHAHGHFGETPERQEANLSADGFTLGPVIVRRI